MPTPTGQAARPQERFEQLSVLGRGGSGVVYLVRDRETGDRLALKRLLSADVENVQRLKREFRSLANLHHRNLIKLYELGQDSTSAYFTMEYLEGEDLERYLDAPPIAANDNSSDEAVEAARIARVLATFEQLAAAVNALHAAAVLHRDLKPSNVMVSNGRVVVLDFGIAVDVGSGATTISQDRLHSGTPAYMAPEQLMGSPPGKPNDWYAFGAMLYQALTGLLPIEGSLAQLLRRKQDQDPTPISQLVPQLPAAIAELCMRLLQRSPQQRPTGEQVQQLLQAHVESAQQRSIATLTSQAPIETVAPAEPALFGREPERAQLWAAFREVQAGACRAVHVSGESGSGKSLLIASWSEELAHTGLAGLEARPLVLFSRCYERETLPYKALDGAMDALVRHLLHEDDVVVSHSLPRDLLPLTQLFPALKRLPATQRLLTGARLPAGVAQARVQAEAALRELLQHLAAQRPLLLWIDDLQWGDLDSIGIVSSWLQAPSIAGMLFVFSYRSEEIATSPGLRLLRKSLGARAEAACVQSETQLRPLGDEDVRALCKQRFAQATLPPAAQAQVVERIVLEARGSPFFASQLAALAVTQPSSSEAQLATLSMEELIRSRSRTLSDSARQLLSVLSVAGRPISSQLAMRVAGVTRSFRGVLHELQTLHLIRTRDSGSERLLEVYHDRLREVVQSLLSADERLALDKRLLAALRESATADMDWLHSLALAVGEDAAALRYGLLAAARASTMLAFERAAELYERCTKLSSDPGSDNGELWQKLASAYAHAGHGSKAAAAYLHAAPRVSPEQALLFERAAASHLICSGRFEEGEALLVGVLERLGLSAPSSEAGLYAALLWERARAKLRGLSFEPRSQEEVPFLEQFATEFCGLLSMETAAYDPLRAALFQARSFRMALATRVPEGIARAMCAAATMTAVEGSERAKLQADELLHRAESISREHDSARLRTNLATARAICAFLTGHIAESIDLCFQAEHLLRTASSDSEYHHRFTLAAARIGAMLQLCQYQRAEVELQVYLKEAAATENINAELHISMAQSWADVNANRLDRAIARLDREREQLPRLGFGLLHAMHMISVVRIGCATGEYDWALRTTEAHWQAFQTSVVRRSDSFSMFAYEAHARLLLCRAALSGEHRQDIRQALRVHCKALSRARRGDAHAELDRIQARIALLHGDKASALRLLGSSSAGFERYGARDQAARDRYALGVLTGGEQGAQLQRAAQAVLRELGIAAPLQHMHGYFPELSEGSDVH